MSSRQTAPTKYFSLRKLAPQADPTSSRPPARRPGNLPAVLVSLAIGLTGCSSGSLEDGLQPIGAAKSAASTIKPDVKKLPPPGDGRYGDRKPVDFGKNHPDRYPVHGIDVSKWQGDIDWNQVRKAGVAFIKATEGGDHNDSRFSEYWRSARAVGIPHAPYHFYYFCRPAREQAAWFIANVPRESVQMPPVLDVEWNHASKTCTTRPDPETVRAEMKIWMDIVGRHFGKRPIIYTPVDFHRENLDGHFQGYQFWLRSVAAHPQDIYPNHPWTFWQYTGTGMMPGIKGDTDINAFAGSKSQWQEWLQKYAR
ncbi:lysozyme [Hoeflea halophila]|uniref:Lysozyme n=1 Tax=Hoeflea halophila TaxID=714899 RepID=A0A286HVI7_9HYPH|nr:GH25 family lysozyme [Hoeflea halophila]SOE11506.1 lysozyme [Hoeflea halophila]